jgi:very-short-patch-repair endonuclease
VVLVPRPTPPQQAMWRNLCLYLRDCVQFEVSSRTLKKAAGSYTPLAGHESIITQSAKTLIIESPRPSFGDQKGKAQYGWPTLVFTAADRSRVTAPLFTVACETSFDPKKGKQIVTAVSDPDLNIALFSPQLLPPELQTAVEEVIGEEPDLQSANDRNTLIAHIAELLNMPLGDLNGDLHTKIPGGIGIHHVATLTAIDDSDTTRDLIAELDSLASRTDWINTSAATLLGVNPVPIPNPKPKAKTFPVAPLQLNENQEEALTRIRTDFVTVVTGPPGTGKSQIVVSAVANAWLAGDRVLLASTNNAAVDVAVQRSNKVSQGLLIRTGNKAARDELPSLITNLAQQFSKRCEKVDVAEAAAALSRVFTVRADFLSTISELEEFEVLLLDVVGQTHDAALKIWAARNTHLANFVNTELAAASRRVLLFPVFRRFRLRRLFSQSGCPGNSKNLDAVDDWIRKCRDFESTRERVQSLRETVMPNLELRLAELDDEYVKASNALIQLQVHDAVAENLKSITGVAATGLGSRKNLDAIRYAMSGLRGWACTALSMKRNFELKPNFFDLVVIDEASQCNLAYILPIAYRSKRITVVGDPNQLPPVITMGSRIARSLAQKNGVDELLQRNSGIDFAEGSAFHAFEEVNGHEETLLLNEHFRCHPRIARWFNHAFYGDSLHVLTDLNSMTSTDRGMFWLDVNGQAERPSSGQSWINRGEVDAVVELIHQFIGQGLTVGVVSPFAAQAALIEHRIHSSLSPEIIADIDLVVGTAHRLQGDERDVVVFSCCITPETFKSSMKWIEQQRNLVNVAVSRAKQSLYIVGHPLIDSMDSPTLASLRAFALASQDDSLIPRRVDSHAEQLLLDAMVKIGLSPLSKIDVEGFELDFALITQNTQFDIEVDGDHHLNHGGSLRRRDVVRDRVLASAGWKVLRFPAWRCWTESHTVAGEISVALNEPRY